MTKFLGEVKAKYFKIDAPEALDGGKVFTYTSGTYTPKRSYPTWNDAVNDTDPNPNPVILDSRGEADIIIRGPTKIILKDAEDNQIWSVDSVDRSEANILDSNGNEVLIFEALPNANNYLDISNASTGNSPVISTKGSDTDVSVSLTAKSDGTVNIPTGDLTITSGDATLLNGDLNGSSGDITVTSGDVILTQGVLSVNGVAYTPYPTGCITWHLGSIIPTGWLECDGSAISRTTYDDLFAVIGTTFGAGNGSTTFNLPDLTRRVLVGRGGTGTGTLGNSIGDTGGAETHTLTTSNLPEHSHEYDVEDGLPHGDVADLEGLPYGTSPTRFGCGASDFDTESAGGDMPHNIMQSSIIAISMIRI